MRRLSLGVGHEADTRSYIPLAAFDGRLGVSIGLAMMLSIAVDVFGVIVVAISGMTMFLLNESTKDEM